MNKKFLMNAAIVSIVGILHGSSSSNEPTIDENAIAAAHAANAVYNITSESDTLHTIAGWQIIKFQKADANSNIQAVALSKGNQVIIAYRGTSCPQDWMANLGIGYAQSYLTKDPIVEHLLNGFNPALTYHGITQVEALSGVFGSDLGSILGKFLSKGASFVAPVYSAATGLANGVNAVKDTASSAIELVNNHKPSSAGGVVLTRLAAWTSPFWVGVGAVGTSLTALAAPPVNALTHFGRTVGGTVKDSFVRWTDSTVASQRQLIFDISRQSNHPYAAYLAEVNAFTRSVLNSSELPVDGAVIQTTGHSLGAHLGTGSFIMVTQNGRGGRIQGYSFTTFARPNGFGGTYPTLHDMGAPASLQSFFSDPKALKDALAQTVVYSHEHDIVARIGHNAGSLGNLCFLPTPIHADYQRDRSAAAINIHHSMKGIVKTLTNAHTDTGTDFSSGSVATSSNHEVDKGLETEEAEMLKKVALSRKENVNMQIAIRNSVVDGKREADQ